MVMVKTLTEMILVHSTSGQGTTFYTRNGCTCNVWSPRQWPEVYDLCNTFEILAWQCFFPLVQHAKKSNRIWYLWPLPSVDRSTKH